MNRKMRESKIVILLALVGFIFIASSQAQVPISGSWSFTLSDSNTKYVNLQLSQMEDAVVGYGELKNGGIATKLAACGSLLNTKLSLYLIPREMQTLYRLSLDIEPGSMNGVYTYSAQGIPATKGTVFGNLISSGMSASTTEIGTDGQDGSLIMRPIGDKV